MRNYLVSNSEVVVVIGGATKTRQEILLAQERDIPIIPIGMSKGAAYNLWSNYCKSQKFKNDETFAKLNNKNPFIVSDAVITILRELILKYKKGKRVDQKLLREISN